MRFWLFNNLVRMHTVASLFFVLVLGACSNANKGASSSVATSAVNASAARVGGTDTSGGNAEAGIPLERYQIQSLIKEGSYESVFHSVYEALGKVRANWRTINLATSNEGYSLITHGNLWDGSMDNYRPFQFVSAAASSYNESFPVLQAFFSGNSARRENLGTAFRNRRFQVHIMETGACWDSYKNEYRDASYSPDGIICFSLDRLMEHRYSAIEARKKITALTIHELAHAYGFSEEVAEKIQSLFLSYPELLENSRGANNFSINILRDSFYSVLEGFARSASGWNGDICMNLARMEIASYQVRADISHALMMDAEEDISNISRDIIYASGFCRPARPPSGELVPANDRVALLRKLLVIRTSLERLMSIARVYYGSERLWAYYGDFEQDYQYNNQYVPELMTTPEYAEIHGISLPEQRDIDASTIHCNYSFSKANEIFATGNFRGAERDPNSLGNIERRTLAVSLGGIPLSIDITFFQTNFEAYDSNPRNIAGITSEVEFRVPEARLREVWSRQPNVWSTIITTNAQNAHYPRDARTFLPPNITTEAWGTSYLIKGVAESTQLTQRFVIYDNEFIEFNLSCVLAM